MSRTGVGRFNIGMLAALVVALPARWLAAQDDIVWGDRPVQGVPWLVEWSAVDRQPPPRPGRGEVRSVSVDFDPDVLRAADNDEFQLRLPSGELIVVEKERQGKPSRRQLVWFGHVRGEPGSDVVLSLADDVLAGTIRSPRRSVHVIDCGNVPKHWLREMQLDFRIPEPPLRGAIPLQLPGPKNACGDPRDEVDVLVVYTDPVVPIYVPTGGDVETIMLGKAQQWIAETNDSFTNSLIDARVRLALVARVGFAESGDLDADVDAVKLDQEVKCLRELVGADLVVLVVSMSNQYDGVAAAPDPEPTPAHGDTAFATVVVAPMDGSLTFPHEIGHLLGAGHDCDDSDASPDAHLDHGFTQPSPTISGTHAWKTIMSTASDLNNPLEPIAYWSNPAVHYPGPGGDPTGATSGSCATDNQQIIESFVGIVSEYRCRIHRRDVWMKDLWADTGEEPDPNTAGEPMWKSPYIWVRRTEDSALEHQHQHQNPARGQSNWIYVKLHNSSESEQSGDVELRVANAATGIEWNSDWDVIGTVRVDHFAPKSCLIVSKEWTSVPDVDQHYCLLARWLSDDEDDQIPASADLPDIEHNVRESNNIVWRNLNIIDLSGFPDILNARVILRYVPEKPQDDDEEEKVIPVTLTIRPDRSLATPSFIGAGRVRVELSEPLLTAWKAAGSHGQGFETDGNGFVLEASAGARFEGLPLVAGHDAELVLHFERLSSTPIGDYGIDVEQRAPDGSGGGVSYSIRCPEVRAELTPPAGGAAPGR